MTRTTLKWLKRSILVLAIIPFLIFLAFAGAVSLIDFNKYKPQIEKEIADLTKRDFTIEGEVEASVLPFVFNVGKLSMKNPPGFKQPYLLTMQEAHIELSLKQLFLSSKLEIISLELIEPKLHLIKNIHGDNWSDIPLLSSWLRKEYGFANEFNAQNLLKSSSSDNQETSSESTPDWYLESLAIKGAEIVFEHEPEKLKVSIKEGNLITFDVRPGESFRVSSDFTYEHSQAPRVFDFEINGDLQLKKKFTQFHLHNWNGVFKLKLPQDHNLPDIRFATIGKQLVLDFERQTIDVVDAVIDGLESQVVTSFQGEFGASPEFKGKFINQQLDIAKWIKRLGFPEPESPQLLKEIKGDLKFHWDGKTLKLERLAKTA